jgi:transposase-like protein
MLRPGVAMMKHAVLFTLISLALICPVMAKPHHGDHPQHDAARKSHHAHHYATRKSHHDHHYAERRSHHDQQDVERSSHHANRYAAHRSHDSDRFASHISHSGITCDMVRAYVAKVGLGQAIAMAKSAGISAADEQRARQCLANKI